MYNKKLNNEFKNFSKIEYKNGRLSRKELINKNNMLINDAQISWYNLYKIQDKSSKAFFRQTVSSFKDSGKNWFNKVQ